MLGIRRAVRKLTGLGKGCRPSILDSYRALHLLDHGRGRILWRSSSAGKL